MSEQTKQPAQSDRSRCDELQQHLLHAHCPEDALADELATHLQQCRSCQAFRAQLVTLDSLTRQQAPELPDGFALSLRRRLDAVEKSADAVEKSSPVARPRRLFQVALAAAAMALITAGALLATRWLGGPEERPTYHRLKLSIRSVQAFDEVLFDVELPEGVKALPATGAVIGRGKHLSWRSPVRRGLNGFDLPLSARRTDGVVTVSLRAGSRVWRGTVPLGSGAKAASAEAPRPLRLAWVLDLTPAGGSR